ncbi:MULTISPECIES: AI-2E family transporter [Prosthecochloris]|uniref:AI-2E family transporter n=1 Tax=Prosthecochloris vibrioformis TaxID=1098 RepID=A0A5C4RY71_PROVB|nr:MULTISPECIES: AI-2E family transporter [Prosthecochloris]ANT65187.1 pheromone autoinducer 2 transporter [Prosthecochloris sp. CIB 2401]TNJ35972.1 AI-2E family transporter [Prosthecochloris vibrioformis]
MQHQPASYTLLAALTGAAALWLGYEVHTALSPILIYIIAVFLIQPLRKNPYIDRLFWGLTLMFGIWAFTELSGLLTPFIIALVLAFLFEPLMNMLVNWRIPRLLSALIITFFGVGGIALVIMLLTPEISRQVTAFAELVPFIPEYLQRFVDWIFSFEIFSWLALDVENFKQQIITSINLQLSNMGLLASNFTQTLLKSIPKVVTAITTIILLPFLTFWFLNDFNRFSDTVSETLRQRAPTDIRKYVPMAGEIFNQYIRGQLIVMLIEMTLYSTIFSIIGINYALLLGILSGMALWIPYIGITTAITLTSLVISLSGNPGEQFLWAGLTYLSIQALEILFMVPKIVGGKVRLNPIVLFLSIFTFGYFFGISGILIAIPASAFLVALIREKLSDTPPQLIEKKATEQAQ